MTTPSLFSLWPHQERAVCEIEKAWSDGYQRVVCQSPTGCHERGHKILLFDGTTIPVEDLRVGDRLIGPDSMPRTILKLHHGFSDMLLVTPVKGEPFRVNRDHIFSIYITPSKKNEPARYRNMTYSQIMASSNYAKHRMKLWRVNYTNIIPTRHTIGFRIQEDGFGEYFGFEVDGDNLYMDANFIVHHNSGKSRILRTIVDNHAQSKDVIYIIAHRNTLVQQLSDEIAEAGIRHGIIQSGSPYIRYRVQVCSMQTLVKRLVKLPRPELVVIDECHHVKASSYMQILNHWNDAKVLGMTATPERTDGSGLDDVFQKIILGESVRSLIDAGFLSDYDYYAPEQVDMTGVHIRAGEYKTAEALDKVDKHVITGSAVEHYKRFADHQPAIAACVSIAHSEHVAQEFRDAGYRALAVNSRMPAIEVARAIAGLRDGSLEVLTQCEMLSEGVDVPGAVALIWLRPTASLIVYLQNCGRVLRKGTNKPKAIILDHVGNYTRFGLPDDERSWSLQGKPKGPAEASKYKRCPACLHGDIPVSARVCKHCGYQWTETAEAVGRIPEQAEGQLVAVKRNEEQQDLILAIARGNARNLKDAIRIARNLGYKHTSAYTVWTNILKKDVDGKSLS